MNNKVLKSKFNFKQYNKNPTDILNTDRKTENKSTVSLRNTINSFSCENESIYETDVITTDTGSKFKDYKKVF